MRLFVVLLSISGLFAADRTDRYALVLSGQPLATAAGKSNAALADSARSVLNAQAALRGALREQGIAVLGSVQNVANAVFVRASEEQAAALRSTPGIARVERMRPLRRHMNRAADLVNATAAWNTLGGSQSAGAGIKIAILDTGIDQKHLAFQDGALRMPDGFPKCSGDECNYTSAKVIVARSYVAMLVLGDEPDYSRPDDLSPRDRVGHGTAAASVAAANIHNAPLARFGGIAPKAYLGNYKIFGSPGVNDVTFEDVVIKALDDAYADGMDVASISLGSPAEWGPNDSGSACGNASGVACDLFSDAVETASRKMTVVVSAGNDGDLGLYLPTLNSIQSPGTAPSAITVGATTNSHILYASVRANQQRYDALFGDGPRLLRPLTAPLRDVAKLGDNGKACAPLGNGTLAGSIALIQRGDCGLAAKVGFAQNAGAVGVVFYQSAGSNFVFAPAGLSGTGIPAALVGFDAGSALKSVANVTLDTALVEQNAEYDTVAYFSSLGPSIGENAIKPEVVAVGTDLYMATQSFDPNGDMFDPSGYTAAQGTSFSAPMVAGAVALAKQRYPNATPVQLKSLVVNTASDVIQDYASDGTLIPASVTAVGAGKLNAGDAVRSTVAVSPATLSFGEVSTGTAAPQKTLTISNLGSQTANFRLSVVAKTPDTIGTLTLSAASVSILSNQSAAVTVRLDGNIPRPGSYEGAIRITGGGVDIRVPYLYLVSDKAAFNIVPLANYDFVGVPNERVPGRLSFKVTDRYGVPVANVPVRFKPAGLIGDATDRTDALGIADASVFLGGSLGEQSFTAEAGATNPLTITYLGRAILRPAINSGGVVNAASGLVAKGLAPGSYISIFGAGLAEATRVAVTSSLPLSLANVSVSFDVPSRHLSVPGHLHFVSSGQINVQVPWEFESLNSVTMKVSIGNFSSALYEVPLAAASPAVFERGDVNGRLVAAVVDAALGVVDTANPTKGGNTIQIYCNGLGAVDSPQASGEPAPTQILVRTKTAAVVTIGGKTAQVSFSGLAPGFVGLYQVNATIPQDTPSGLQPLVIAMPGGFESKPANLPIQ